ncbi:MAG: HD domain-containing phosphohydrolase [Actinomycetota bacterium]|nr:HD domain-containing phosphohydrolase [Actinomycetota bacterium]
MDLNLTIDNLKQQKKQVHASCVVIEGRHQDCSIVVFLKDLTGQKQREYKLESSLNDLKNNYRGIIDAFSHMVQIKDPYTASHQEKVARLCRAMAGEMNLDKKTAEGLSYAAAIHDIGKINIPASLLAKPGKLTDIEYRMISTHSQLGYNIVKKISFPWPIEKILLQHHERMDGSGYPRNLAGEEIMMEARILAIADVVEAMSSHRPYRPALGIGKALQEIENNQDKLYDAAAAKACISLFRQKNYRF